MNSDEIEDEDVLCGVNECMADGLTNRPTVIRIDLLKDAHETNSIDLDSHHERKQPVPSTFVPAFFGSFASGRVVLQLGKV